MSTKIMPDGQKCYSWPDCSRHNVTPTPKTTEELSQELEHRIVEWEKRPSASRISDDDALRRGRDVRNESARASQDAFNLNAIINGS